MDQQNSQTPPPQQQTPPPIIQENNLTQSDQQIAMWCHLIPLIASILGIPLGFLGPLIIMNTGMPRHQFILEHAKESLNFQISLWIYVIIGLLLAIFTLGLGLILVVPALIGIGIAYIIFAILASMAANNGQYYRYPICIRFVK